jgi:hypothetical protein
MPATNPPNPQRAHFAKVLLALKFKLNNDCLPSSGYVYISHPDQSYLDEDTLHRYAVPPAQYAERFISISCGPITFRGDYAGAFNQAGRYSRTMQRTVTIGLSTRISLDRASEAEVELTDEIFGHMYFEEKIIKSLDLINPPEDYSTLANWDDITKKRLLIEPLKLSPNNSTPRNNQKSKPADNMLVSFLNFDAQYIFPFTSLT